MGGGADVLVIDDDRDLVNTIRIILESENYRVRTAYNGREGYQRIEDKVPDLIILDVMMDTATEGFHFSLTLKDRAPDSEFAAYRDTPILMLTAVHTTTPLRFAPNEDYLPVESFLEKSASPEEILAKVEELLGQA